MGSTRPLAGRAALAGSVLVLALPPADRAAYARYLQALIGRYGPDGGFWSLNPSLAKRAIRVWQIFNEPSASYQWTVPQGQDWAPSYGRVLRTAYAAVKQADPRAR